MGYNEEVQHEQYLMFTIIQQFYSKPTNKVLVEVTAGDWFLTSAGVLQSTYTIQHRPRTVIRENLEDLMATISTAGQTITNG